jgi:hypothetical protein
MSMGSRPFFRPTLMSLESRDAPAIMSIPHLPISVTSGPPQTPLALQIARAVSVGRPAAQSAASPAQQHLPPVHYSPFTEPAGITTPGMEFLTPAQSANLFHNTNPFLLGATPSRILIPAWTRLGLTTTNG